MREIDVEMLCIAYLVGLFVIPFVYFISELSFNLIDILSMILVFHSWILLLLLFGIFDKEGEK